MKSMSMNGNSDLVFSATLEDNVTPQVKKLEESLKKAGASRAEIKMFLRAYDQATPKIQEAQRQLERLPKQQIINIHANVDQMEHKVRQSHMNMQQEMDRKPLTLTFKDNLNQIMGKVKGASSNLALPLASALPMGVGYNFYWGLGAGSLAGAGAGVGQLLQSSIAINSQMEQSLATLTQTLKDPTRARQESGQLVSVAQKTPFNYSDVLQSDVLLRSYQIPSLPPPGGVKKGTPPNAYGPHNQGWLKAAGDMASAMGTNQQQAVLAIAESRQGYFRRLLDYGIRLDAQDFSAGGKYAGLTYEQGLMRAIRPFEGSQQVQSGTFKGITSNIHDIAQQQIIRPIGTVPFEWMKSTAKTWEDKAMNSPTFQRDLGKKIQEVQRGLVSFFMDLKKGKEYFDENMKVPIEQAVSAIMKFSKALGQGFGGPILTVVKTFAQAIETMTKPLQMIAGSGVGQFLTQWLGFFKALSFMGVHGVADPFSNLAKSVNPLTFSLRGIIGSLIKIPGAIAKVGMFVLIKNFVDAHQAATALRNSMSKVSGTDFAKIQAQIMGMAHGMDLTATHAERLATQAAQGIPSAIKNRPHLAVEVTKQAGILHDQYGLKPSEVVAAITSEMGKNNAYTKKAVDQFANDVKNAAMQAKALGTNLSGLTHTLAEFGPSGAALGLNNIKGAPYLAAAQKGLNSPNLPLSKAQLNEGIYNPDELLVSMLRGGSAPSVDMLRGAGGPKVFDKLFKFRGFNLLPASATNSLAGNFFSRSDTYHQNDVNMNRINSLIHGVAPDARIPQVANPWEQMHMGTDFGQIRKTTNPLDRANLVFKDLDKNQTMLDSINTKVTDATNKQNKLTSAANAYGQALDNISLKMQMFEHTLVPLQRAIEDQQTAMEDYSFKALRPLERALTRLNQAAQDVSFTMQNAQYDMGKYTDGLLTGEQAVLDNLHSLENYNKQLQLLQLLNMQLGHQLGQTTYERGYSAFVKPMVGLTMELQMQQNERKQQEAQLRYDLTYGEGHYQMQQAARPFYQRKEMPLSQRLAGINKDRPIIDQTTRAQQNLSVSQHELQVRMFKVNEVIANQQDKLTKLQLSLQKMQQSKYYRHLQDEQYGLQIASTKTNIALTLQQQYIDRLNSTVVDLKNQGKDLTQLFTGMLQFKGRDPSAVMKDLIAFYEKLPANLGGITKRQGDQMMAYINQVMDAPRKKSHDWFAEVKQNLFGLFSGDTWRTIGAQMNAGLSTIVGPSMAGFISGAFANVAQGATILVGAGLVASLGRLALGRTVNAAVAHTRLGSGFATGGRDLMGGIASRTGGDSNAFGRFFGRRQESFDSLAKGTRLGGTWKEALTGPFRLIRNMRGILGRLIGTTLGTVAGGIIGGPPGAIMGGLLGGSAGRRYGEDHSVREMGKAAKDNVKASHENVKAARDFVHGGKDSKKGGADTKKGGAEHKSAARSFGTHVKEQSKNAKIHLKTFSHAADKKFGGHVGSFLTHVKAFGSRAGRFGKFVGAFALAASLIQSAAGEIGKIFSDFGKFLSDHLPGFHHTPKVGSHAASIGGKAAQHAHGKVGAFSKWGGRILKSLGIAGNVVGAVNLGSDLLGGRYGAAVGDASWFAPGVSEFMALSAISNLLGGPGKEWDPNDPHFGHMAHQDTARRHGIRRPHTHVTNDPSGDYRGMRTPHGTYRDRQGRLRDSRTHHLVRPHAGGLPYVPYDGYLAQLHQGERVLTAGQANQRRSKEDQIADDLNQVLDISRTNIVNKASIASRLSSLASNARSLAGGIGRVPYDGYLALLHQDEAVLPAGSANNYRNKSDKNKETDQDLSTLDTYHGKVQDRTKIHLDKLGRLIGGSRDRSNKSRDTNYKDDLDKQGSHHRDLETGVTDHSTVVENIRSTAQRQMNNIEDSGYGTIYTTTKTWLGKVSKAVGGLDTQLGLTHSDNNKAKAGGAAAAGAVTGHASGGLLRGDPYKIGPGRLVRVNEEGHDEVIIPLAPHRRSRAKSLVDQTKAMIGYANGGMAHSAHWRGHVFKGGTSTFGPPTDRDHRTAYGHMSHEAGIAINPHGDGNWNSRLARSLQGHNFIVTVGHHSAVLPVIDKGPYASGRVIDITGAGARKMGIDPRHFPTGHFGYAAEYAQGGLARAVRNIQRFAAGGYTNPFPRGASPSRIDMGADYFGSGQPIVAIGDANVTNVGPGTGGWGPQWINYQLQNGRYAGQHIYVAEHVAPSVRGGQHVRAGQKIGNFTGAIEIGFAVSGGNSTLSMGAAQGGDTVNSAPGVAMSNLIASLGGPSAIPQGGGVVGTFLGKKVVLGKASSGGSSGSMAVNLPKVPKQLLQMGLVGPRLYAALKKKRKKWAEVAGGMGTTAGGGSVSAGGLTPGQATFGTELSKATGIDPRVVRAWMLAEESGGAAAAREAAHNFNWLNIGYFDSGAGGITKNSVWGNPDSAAQHTAMFLKGTWGGASAGIRSILRSVPKGALAEIMAIANSGWASSGYNGGSTLRQLAHLAGGIGRVPYDGYPAVLHKDEAVLTASQANYSRSKHHTHYDGARGEGPGAGLPMDSERAARHAMDLWEETLAQIKKMEHHLRDIKDQGAKKKEEQNLAALNALLRTRWAKSSAANTAAGKALQARIAATGDPSDGEGTSALVAHEQESRNQFITAALNKAKHSKLYKTAVRNARRAAAKVKSAITKAHSAHSPGGHKVTSAEKRHIDRLKKAARRAGRRPGQILAQARKRGDADYVISAAHHGVNADLMRAIRGKALGTSAIREHGKVKKVDEKSLYNQLAKALQSGNMKSASKLSKELRMALMNDGTKSRKMLQGIDKHASKRHSDTVKNHTKSVAARAKQHSSDVKDRANHAKEAKKMHEQSRKDLGKTSASAKKQRDQATKETSRVNKSSIESDKKRTKAENASDKREKDFYKKALEHLQAIRSKNMTVNVQNTATGATLRTSINGGRRRSR